MSSPNGSGRGDLADAIVDRSNPLTARVIVNRVWQQLIGRPLVGTPSNFGSLGDTPSHPELLDDLAVRFMDNGWSLKWLQREIVLSSTYGQSSDVDPKKSNVDPENRLLWRIPRRRLSVEAYRDAVLFVSGRLEQGIGGQSLQPDAARFTTTYGVQRSQPDGFEPDAGQIRFSGPKCSQCETLRDDDAAAETVSAEQSVLGSLRPMRWPSV